MGLVCIKKFNKTRKRVCCVLCFGCIVPGLMGNFKFLLCRAGACCVCVWRVLYRVKCFVFGELGDCV